MKLDVSVALKNPGQAYPFQGEQTIAPIDVYGDEVTFDPAVVKGAYTAVEDGSVTVEGQLTTVAHAPCAKCLEPASAEIQASFRETFLRDGDPEDDEIFAYAGSVIGFEKLAMSYAVLNMPMRFLCSEACEGFDEYTGADTETEQKEMQSTHPFAALQQLLDSGAVKEDEEV